MELLNADGSRSEVSGNGVRCLAAWLAETRQLARAPPSRSTPTQAQAARTADARRSRPDIPGRDGAAGGIARRTLAIDGTPVDVVTLRVGNPQCVVLGDVSEARFNRLASRLAVHAELPGGDQRRVRRGGGPRPRADPDLGARRRSDRTSGTGACAAVVAAMRMAAPGAKSTSSRRAARSASNGEPTVSTSRARRQSSSRPTCSFGSADAAPRARYRRLRVGFAV